MSTKIRDGNGNVIGYLEKRGDQILMLSPQGEEWVGQFGDAVTDVIGSGKAPDRIPYRNKEGNLQGWLCHEGERFIFRGTNGAIDGYYEKIGDRVICRSSDGSIVSGFENGPERDELFGSLEEERGERPTPLSIPGRASVGAGRVASTGLLGGCLAAGGLPAILGVLFFSIVIAWYLSPLFAVIGALAIWYVIVELRKPETDTSKANHRTLVIILIILGWLELQTISCMATRFFHH